MAVLGDGGPGRVTAGPLASIDVMEGTVLSLLAVQLQKPPAHPPQLNESEEELMVLNPGNL